MTTDLIVDFDTVLDELRVLFLALADIAQSVTLIGGQVIAVLARSRGGSGEIEITTSTGVTVSRGFSMEPDLLVDFEALGPRADVLLDVLGQEGFTRVRSYRWRKSLGRGASLYIDLFANQDADPSSVPAAGVTRLTCSDGLGRTERISINLPGGQLEMSVPSAADFLLLKFEAEKVRPEESKDCFDAYVYCMMVPAVRIGESIRSHPRRGEIVSRIRELFSDVAAKGVVDVLTYAATLDTLDQDLLARGVVDAWDAVLARV